MQSNISYYDYNKNTDISLDKVFLKMLTLKMKALYHLVISSLFPEEASSLNDLESM